VVVAGTANRNKLGAQKRVEKLVRLMDDSRSGA
jgi:hypothetical protein